MTANKICLYLRFKLNKLENPFGLCRTITVALAIVTVLYSCLPYACAQTSQAALTQVHSSPGTSAQADILIEAYGGTVLHEKNADKHMLIASTTKILTALIVLENCDPYENVIIKNDFPVVEGSSIYLKPGETLRVLDLLYGLLLESGNDAAIALALHVSGSVAAFAELMNEYAEKLGCRNSHFLNPHGLDKEGHYSSARDLALIAAEAMKNKTFCDIVSTKQIALAGRHFKNHNKLLWNCPGALGIKTGFTESAGRSLVSCTERDGMRLICVTLSAPDDWDDHTNLYKWAFREFGCLNLANDSRLYENIPVISGVKDSAQIHPAEDFIYVYSRSDKIELFWDIAKFVYAPVGLNERAGLITVTKNGIMIKEIPLIYSEAVDLDSKVPLSFFEKLKWSLFNQK